MSDPNGLISRKEALAALDVRMAGRYGDFWYGTRKDVHPGTWGAARELDEIRDLVRSLPAIPLDHDLISRKDAKRHLRDVDIPYLGVNASFAREWAASELDNVDAALPVLETPPPSDEDENVLRKVAWAIRGATYTERATSGEPVGEGLAADEERSPRSWEELPDEARKMWLGDAMSALKACDYFELRRNRDRWESIAKSRAPVEPVPADLEILREWANEMAGSLLTEREDESEDRLALMLTRVTELKTLVGVEPVPPNHEKCEQAILEVIDERDEAQEWADKLAHAIGHGDEGEHSNLNNPWATALEIAESRGVEPIPAKEAK